MAPTSSWRARPAAWTSRRWRRRTRSGSSASGRDPRSGSRRFQARALAFGLGLSGDQFKAGVGLIQSLFRAYLAKDCSLAEVNPLVVTRDGRVLALDAKLNFDDSALFRRPEVVALRDVNEEDPLDVEASKHGLNYIKLDGTVGCMVNGAGLAMATMDIVKLAGGAPANFLDVGGGASPEQIESAFRILSSDPSVKAVFINVFGGILRCDRLAAGLISAVTKLGVRMPDRRPDGGHQRRARPEDAGRLRPQLHQRGRHGRRRPESRRPRRRGQALTSRHFTPVARAP